MITCDMVGISGGCGADCPIYLAGECEFPPEPYRHVCVDDCGVSLSLGGEYEILSRDDGLVTVVDNDGEKKQFFESRFEVAGVAHGR